MTDALMALCFLIGCGLLIGGAAILHPVAGLLVAGFLLALIPLLWARGAPRV